MSKSRKPVLEEAHPGEHEQRAEKHAFPEQEGSLGVDLILKNLPHLLFTVNLPTALKPAAILLEIGRQSIWVLGVNL